MFRISNHLFPRRCLLLIAILCLTHVHTTHGAGNRTKVFGVGLSKTGTSSLHDAVVKLWYRSIHEDKALVPYLYPHHQHDSRTIFNMTAHYNNMDAAFDLPTAMYYQELLAAFPNARFVLTVRDADQWFKAFSEHCQRTVEFNGGVVPVRVARLREAVYGSSVPDKDVWIERYKAHNARVHQIIPPQQLLVMDITRGDGWVQLCDFLSVSYGPCAASQRLTAPFPRSNSKDKSIEQMIRLKQETQVELQQSSAQHTRYAYVSFVITSPKASLPRYVLQGLLKSIDSVRAAGSSHDIILMVLGKLSEADQLIIKAKVTRILSIRAIGRGVTQGNKKNASDSMAALRAKSRTLQLIDYERVLYFDPGHVLRHGVDTLFNTEYHFLARSSADTPLDASVFVVKPSWQAFVDVKDIIKAGSFRPASGFMSYGPITDWRVGRAGEKTDWTFKQASGDQGLFYFYYFCFPKPGPAALVGADAWDHLITSS